MFTLLSLETKQANTRSTCSSLPVSLAQARILSLMTWMQVWSHNW